MHGIKGTVKLKTLTAAPENIIDYSPLYDESGKKQFHILSAQVHGTVVLAELKEITDRTAAEKLRGLKLYAPRDILPDITTDKTFYIADLIGLEARFTDGTKMGVVINVMNFGASDLLEIKPLKGASFYVPFTDAVVPQVQVADGFVVVDPPEGLL